MRRQKFRRLEMKTIEPFSRRNFLISSVALAGGVAFGSYAAAQEKAAYLVNPLASDLGPDSATFNAWVKISPEKITLITPHSDSGQGIVSALAALIAEEMDLEFGQFVVDFGLPHAAYAKDRKSTSLNSSH